MLKAPIEFLRSARLTNIESLCAHLNRNGDRIILGPNTTGEKGTCSYGGAKDGPGTHGGCLAVHVNFLLKALTMVRFIDNESSRGELDTSEFAMTVEGGGLRRRAEYFGCHFGPGGLICKMRGNFMVRHGYG